MRHRWREALRRGWSQVLEDLDPNRLHVFVPAIMSVGLLFSLASVLRDVLRWRGERALVRRSEQLGERTAAVVLDRPVPVRAGFARRRWYVTWALIATAAAGYVAVASVIAYGRAGGRLFHLSFVLAAGLVAAVVLAGIGAGAAVVARRNDGTPVWAVDLLRRSRLAPAGRSAVPSGPVSSRPELLWLAAVGAIVAIAHLAVIARGWEPGLRLDRAAAERIREMDWLVSAQALDPLGRTEVAVALAALIGLAAFRCRVLALTYPGAVVVAVTTATALKGRIPYARPDPGPFAGLTESFPSGHMIQATLTSALLPVAVGVLVGRRGLVVPGRLLLGVALALTGLARVHDGLHWPSDIVEGVLVGLVIALITEWLLEHRDWHRHCPNCLWHPASARPRRRGALPLAHGGAAAARLVARTWSLAAVVVLVGAALTAGLPRNENGQGFAVDVQTPLLLGFAGLAAVAIAVAWRWEAIGAVLLAVAATGLAVFSAVELEPLVALGLGGLLTVPAVLFWVSWQHRRRWGEIVLLALSSASLLGAGWIGANAVYDSAFGPTHPASSTAAFAVDRVEWVWSGALRPDGATVVARVDGTAERVAVAARGEDGEPGITSSPVAPDDDGIARVTLDGLRPGHRYQYAVVVDGHHDRARGTGSLTTPPDGPFSFRIALGACARTGSNASVFDRIRAEDPLFLLHLGDLHYRNIGVDSRTAFRAAYQQVLTSPAPAALWRSTPVVYTWDDHDFGGNDSGATTPSRDAARAVYRQVVPSHDPGGGGGGGEGTINQAFTIGRVRFVITDSRSERRDGSMLGAAQRQWLLDELTAASRTHALVVWANPVPWIQAPGPDAEGWGAFPEERRLIADALARAEVRNLVMLSGDAHMVAIDDGTNSDYSTERAGGFPILHAAAFDRPGNVKGGPYSHGTFPGGGQYGLFEVHDDGGPRVGVRLIGRDWRGRDLVSWEGSFTPPGPRDGQGS